MQRCYKTTFITAPSVTCISIWCHVVLSMVFFKTDKWHHSFWMSKMYVFHLLSMLIISAVVLTWYNVHHSENGVILLVRFVLWQEFFILTKCKKNHALLLQLYRSFISVNAHGSKPLKIRHTQHSNAATGVGHTLQTKFCTWQIRHQSTDTDITQRDVMTWHF